MPSVVKLVMVTPFDQGFSSLSRNDQLLLMRGWSGRSKDAWRSSREELVHLGDRGVHYLSAIRKDGP